MDIINRDNKYVRLTEICIGECFKLDGYLYIKTDRGCARDNTSDCIKLSSGCKETLSDELRVEEVEATIIIGETPTTLMQKGMI